jgi:hypothetical protein
MRINRLLVLPVLALAPVICGTSSALALTFTNPFNGSTTSGDWANDLVQVYQGQCNESGTLTAAAIGDNQILQGLIGELASDPKCVGLTNNLSAVTQAQGQLASMLNNSSAVQQVAMSGLQAQVNQLLQAYAVTSDPTLQSTLALEIATAQSNLFQYPAQARLAQLTQQYSAAEQLSILVDNSMNSIAANQACLQKSPTLGLQLVAQLTAISSGLMTGGAAPLVEVGATVVNGLMNYVHNAPYAKMSRDSQQIVVGPSLGCALEATANTYCHARDVKKLASDASGPLQHAENDPFWQGLSLTSTGLLELNNWVSSLISASAPSDQFSASGDQHYINLRASFEDAKPKMEALITKAAQQEAAALNATDQDNIRAGLLKDLITAMNGFVVLSTDGYTGGGGGNGDFAVGSSSAFYRIFTIDPGCLAYDYLRTGSFNRVPRPIVGGGSVDCSIWYNGQPEPTTAVTQTRTTALLVRAQVDVDSQVNSGLQIDTLGVLQNFDTGTSPLPSPRQAMKNILAYFQSVSTFYGAGLPGNTAAAINNMTAIITNALSIIDNQVMTADAKIAALLDDTNHLSLAPSRRQLFISGRVENLVRWDFQQRIKNAAFQNGITNIYKDTVQDTLLLNKQLGNQDLGKVIDDANNAKGIAFENLNLLYSTFNKQIDDYITRLKKQAAIDPETGNGRLQNVCMQLLTVPDISVVTRDKTVMSACSGLIKPSAYSQSTAAVDFTKQLANTDAESRICALYELFRSDRIFAINRNNQ